MLVSFNECMCVCAFRPFDQPHGDGDRDRCSHCVYTLYFAQCHLPYVPVAEAELKKKVCAFTIANTHAM